MEGDTEKGRVQQYDQHRGDSYLKKAAGCRSGQAQDGAGHERSQVQDHLVVLHPRDHRGLLACVLHAGTVSRPDGTVTR